jgi:hypothetical protein
VSNSWPGGRSRPGVAREALSEGVVKTGWRSDEGGQASFCL